jgi:hypothetical protein
MTAAAHAAVGLLELLKDEGPSLRFLAAFAEASREAQRLVVNWLSLGCDPRKAKARSSP